LARPPREAEEKKKRGKIRKKEGERKKIGKRERERECILYNKLCILSLKKNGSMYMRTKYSGSNIRLRQKKKKRKKERQEGKREEGGGEYRKDEG
jgi:hypothetical protein